MITRSDWLVAAQFVLLVLLAWPGESAWSNAFVTTVSLVLLAVGLAIGLAGVITLGTDLVPWVAPKPGAPLRTSGIFRVTRNPIYLGLLTAGAGWVVWRGRVEVLAVWVLLAVVLVTKAHIEQRHLLAAFGDDYRRYAERTPLILWGRGIR